VVRSATVPLFLLLGLGLGVELGEELGVESGLELVIVIVIGIVRQMCGQVGFCSSVFIIEIVFKGES
jgi:hypothetical protein